jgi:RNA 2',3'-cyclic 3'-phosphodiesterase
VKQRLFAAIDLDEAALGFVEATIARLRDAGLEARFQPREKWHATVAFLGAVEVERYAQIVSSLRSAAAKCDAFALTLDQLGAFPSMQRPRVVWIGCSGEQPAYALLSGEVRNAMAAVGFAFENDAVAHVTLCRLREHHVKVPAIELPAAVSTPIDSLSLYQSIPDGRTTRYALRERFALRQT